MQALECIEHLPRGPGAPDVATAAATSDDIPGAQVTGARRLIIVGSAMMAMIMQILDMTIANVALPHMQTSLGATPETVTWVLTSYIVASAVAMPITGWLSDRLGRKVVFVSAIASFTLASTLCAVAVSLPEMVLFRILQGISGALIAPICQALLLDVYPKSQHARAMTFFSAGTLLGPIIGPVLGGWITKNLSWHWVFLVNLPIGVVCTLLLLRYMPRFDRTRRPVDLFGFGLLAIALGALQLLLDRGQTLDWFSSWEIWLECGVAIGAGWMFAVHMITARDPLFEPAMFADRNFLASVLIGIVVGVVAIGGSALLPSFLQGLLSYSVMEAGVATAPRGIGALIAMPLIARMHGRVDPRLLVSIGLALVAFSLWHMTEFNLEMDRRPVLIANFIQGLGLAMASVPVTVLAFATMEERFRTSGASLLNVTRNIGGSIGVSLATTLLARNIQTSHSDLGSHITSSTVPILDQSVIGSVGAAADIAITMVDAEINRQAAMIAYLGDFHLMMLATIISAPVALLLRVPRRSAGERPMIVE